MASTIKVNTIQDAGGNSLLVSNGSGSITTNNINVKDIDWQSVKTADFTAVAGEGYFVNTTSGTITLTLPASPSAGDTVAIVDYAGTFGTNKVTIGRNSSNIQGAAVNATLSISKRATTFIYSDATKGWIPVNDNTTNDYGEVYTEATGGTVTTSGNFKIHTFNSTSNFVASQVGNPAGGTAVVSYLVIAGGGGGGKAGNRAGGGGGAGGFREGRAANDSYTVSPLNAPAGLTITAQTYPITVGAGGGGSPSVASGSDSVFSTITSSGGGSGGEESANIRTGGSGGGAGGAVGPGQQSGAAGNTPPVSPSQGFPGGDSTPSPSPSKNAGGGGGGATAQGGDAPSPGSASGAGGAGATTHISGSPVQSAGGGSASGQTPGVSGGAGGGGSSTGPTDSTSAGTAGSANTGGGGGAGGPGGGGSGGSGVVIIRYKYQ